MIIKRHVKWQRVFNIVSVVFLISCVIFYGSRYFIYKNESKKKFTGSSNNGLAPMVETLKWKNYNKDYFVNVRGEYYFYGRDAVNYVRIGKQLFRIIKFNYDGSVRMIRENTAAVLAYGDGTFSESNISLWLNGNEEEHTGIYAKTLANQTLLAKSSICLDVIDEVKTNCDSDNDSYYISLPSIMDYLNTGADKSFINNKQNIYLENKNSDGKVWYVNDSNVLGLSSSDVLMGIRPIVTLKNDVGIISGDGTKENPYIIEENKDILYEDYVKLGNDMWRVIEVMDNKIKLVLNYYLKDGDKDLEHIYSTSSTVYNITKKDSLAYYLNNDYLNSLDYKDIIVEGTWFNGAYGKNYVNDYRYIYNKEVVAKVGTFNLNDVMIDKFGDYITMTPINTEVDLMFTVKENASTYGKNVTGLFKIIPMIYINKDVLKSGNGTLNSPWVME